MPVKVMGRLPDGERNALADLAERLADDPHAEICAVVTLRPRSTEVLVDDDDEVTVKLRILDVEIIEGVERGFVEAAARSAREQRTGRRSLPGFGTILDPSEGERLVAEWARAEAERATAAPDGVDPATGEIDDDPPPSGRPGGHD